jgi:hypothetical protein
MRTGGCAEQGCLPTPNGKNMCMLFPVLVPKEQKDAQDLDRGFRKGQRVEQHAYHAECIPK